MKIGIISDIHSNIIALKACTAYMESIFCNEYLFLGDYVSDTPYTRETLDYLYDFKSKHNCLFLRGNREDYMLKQRHIITQGIENKRMAKRIQYGLSHLCTYTFTGQIGLGTTVGDTRL
ncbi:MAG: hypothetical protein HFG34_08690 [Eubacterium sp.]|nr:hypothetical protein [Eubacterium sp.]